MGSKRRIAKEILPIILKDRGKNQPYVELFVGGANVIDRVDGRRIGVDSNYYLISLLNALKNGWLPPRIVTEEEYQDIKNYPLSFRPEMVGYAGFQLSYGAMWFSSYRRDNTGKRNYSLEAFNNVAKQAKNLKGIEFVNCSYEQFNLDEESIVYCDPPYKNTAGYGIKFNHDQYYDYLRRLSTLGHKVFCSEYFMPDDFVCLWEKKIHSSLTKQTGAKYGVEKLFYLPV